MAAHPKVHPVDVEAPPTVPLVPRNSSKSDQGDPAEQYIPHRRTIPVRHSKPPTRKRSCRCKFICWTISLFLLLVILLAATGGILYAVFRPKLPKYSIDRLRISDFQLNNNDSSLYARFDVTITAENPNKNIGIYYEKCPVSVSFIARHGARFDVTITAENPNKNIGIYYEKCPVSVSFIARHGADRFLLDTVQTMYSSLQEQAENAAKSSVSSGQEESAEIAKEKGNNAFKDKQWQKAIAFYTEAIKLNGKNATYYSNRAAAYLEVGSSVQAEADCNTAITLDKKNVKSYLRRGTAREMLGYYKEAMEDFGYALVLEPTNKRASLSAERLKKLFI